MLTGVPQCVHRARVQGMEQCMWIRVIGDGLLERDCVEWDEIKLGKGRRKNLVFSESHDAPL